MHIAIQEHKEIVINPIKKSKVEVKVETSIFDKISTIIPAEYSDYRDILLAKNAIELPKHIKINIHAIELEKNKQSSFRLIYNRKQMELETLKTYIKANLANDFIHSFNSFA